MHKLSLHGNIHIQQARESRRRSDETDISETVQQISLIRSLNKPLQLDRLYHLDHFRYLRLDHIKSLYGLFLLLYIIL
jgi:hypothetical protein